MPITNQAKKALRQSKKKHEYNLKIKQDLKTLLKKTRQAIDAKDAKVDQLLKQVQKSIDKAVQKSVIKKNTGTRTLSRLMAYYKKSSQPVKEEQKNDTEQKEK